MGQLYSAIGVVDTWVIIIYLLIIVGIGIFCSYFVKSSKDYSSAGQNLGLGVLVGTTLSSFFGAYSGSGGLELVHTYGLAGLTLSLGANVGWIVLALMGKRLRGSGALTLPQFISMNYGENTRISTSVVSMVYLIGQVGGQLVACGTVASLLGICSFSEGILYGGIIIILLTVFGGLVGVAWTGAIQQIFITVLCVIAVPVIAYSQAGGVAAVFEAADPIKTSLFAGAPLSYLIGMFLSQALSFTCEPAYAQRIFVAKDEKTATRAAPLSDFLSVLMMIPLYTSVLALPLLFPEASGNAFVPTIIENYMPPVVKGLGLAAFISLLLTTADTMLMTSSSVFTTDIWPLIRPNSSDKTILLAGRLCVVVMGILAIIMGIYFQSVATVMLLFVGSYGAAIAPSIFFAVFAKKNPVESKIVPYAVIITFFFTLVLDLLSAFPTEVVFLGLPLNLIILLAGSKYIRSKNSSVAETS